MSDQVCAQCGARRTEHECNVPQMCDGCGSWICPSCFEKLETTYTPNKTKIGIVGYLKLCDKCRERYHNTPIQEHPYIG